jgi:hypothetical protein
MLEDFAAKHSPNGSVVFYKVVMVFWLLLRTKVAHLIKQSFFFQSLQPKYM